MDVEVRFVEVCHNLRFTRQRLGVALDAVGWGDIDVRFRTVRTDAEAAELGFTGSPTILINGADRSRTLTARWACPVGSIRALKAVSGSPSVEKLITALANVDPE